MSILPIRGHQRAHVETRGRGCSGIQDKRFPSCLNRRASAESCESLAAGVSASLIRASPLDSGMAHSMSYAPFSRGVSESPTRKIVSGMGVYQAESGSRRHHRQTLGWLIRPTDGLKLPRVLK
jgi:hypothetical protein